MLQVAHGPAGARRLLLLGSAFGQTLAAWTAVAALGATVAVLSLAHGLGAGAPRTAAAAHPLSWALAPDGTLRATSGSFDARGYRMVFGRGGVPRFVRASAGAAAGTAGGFAALGAGQALAAPGDNFWSDRFGDVGVANGGNVDAVAVSGSKIYIGGQFSSLGADSGIVANDVAMWNGHGWFPLGSGIGTASGSVKALAVIGGKLYAGGSFATAGGVSVNNLAMWNGTSWSDVGGGVTAAGTCCVGSVAVNALAVSGSTLYVGGAFNDVGAAGATTTAHSIAAWNTATSTWSTLGNGIGYCNAVGGICSSPETGAVNALLVSGSTIYAGGRFNVAGTSEIEDLAAWDGTNWSAVGGNGIRQGSSLGTVDALASDTSTTPATLYIGGGFDHVGATVSRGTVTSPGVGASAVAQWNGTTWSPLGSGASSGGTPTVYALAYWNGHLYMSGSFNEAGNDGTPNIAQWDGSSWAPVGPGLDGVPMALTSSGGVIAAGSFGTANGSALLNDVGLWNGAAWRGYGLGTSLNAHATNTSPVTALATSSRTLYAGGTFSYAGWTPTSGQGLARFDGTSWHTMPGATVNSGVLSVAVYGKYVFVAGSFSFPAAEGTANNIAVWDGSQWHALGDGRDGSVHALLVYQGKLWVGGSFGLNIASPSDIATWNLANLTIGDYTNDGWSAVGGNPTYHGNGVYALAGWTVSSTEHYVIIGGNFQYITDGTTGYGTNSLLAYRVENSTTGRFDGYSRFAGANNTLGVTANNGSQQGDVYTLLVDGNNLYVGGSFTEAGNETASGLGLCNLPLQSSPSGCWQTSPGTFALTSGTPVIRSMAKVQSAYYLAGKFDAVTDASNNTVSASNIVQYTPSTNAFATLGSGLGAAYSGPQAYALAEGSDGLYVGGLFGLAGGKPSATVGLWTGTALPSVKQAASAGPYSSGAPVTFTSAITNSSAITWSGLKLTETLPSSLTYDSSSISTTGGSCTATATTPVKLTCSVGNLSAGAPAATVSITVTPTSPGRIANTVALTASGYSFSNTARTSITVN